RRLSIIDLRGGRQPLANEDGTIQVVFNGEIYNFRELRRELEKKGHRFATRTDTEVLVHLYEEAGERMPEYLNGMFAFAIWDGRERRLLLARDRLGKKPLYYTTRIPGLRFSFASELKALASLPGFPRKVKPESVADFLSLSYVPDPETVYEDVHKLRPGHTLTVTDADEVRERCYWAPAFTPGEASADNAREELEALVRDAVERRMISDVPLGAFLSGGIDSSLVVSHMVGAESGPVKTFSIGFTEKRFDELTYARAVAQRYQTEHREKVVSPDVHDMMDVLIRHYDEPFGDSSAIPTLYLARMTRENVTVALSGDGADELFAGYRRYRFAMLEEQIRRRLPGWFRCTVVSLGARLYPKFDYLPQVFRAKALLRDVAQELAGAYFSSMSVFGDRELARVLSPEFQRSLHGYSPREAYRQRFTRWRHLPPLEQLQAVDLETYLPGDILVKADRATMAYSLETRSPWLDYRIAEFAGQLPTDYKLRDGQGKYLLRLLSAGRIPEVVVRRRKMGFSVPLAQWFRQTLRRPFESLVLAARMEEYCNLREMRRLWREHQAGFRNHDRKLWNLLMLSCWDRYHRNQEEAPWREMIQPA
ncbi:asparagine synthase (glutamine-hydrolyzing), partial [candidate division WOR-3 bacterium]|nr:asparagine synthase (glutamine-hydrolyzing) [candidate division WOR-3 bacterium]